MVGYLGVCVFVNLRAISEIHYFAAVPNAWARRRFQFFAVVVLFASFQVCFTCDVAGLFIQSVLVE